MGILNIASCLSVLRKHDKIDPSFVERISQRTKIVSTHSKKSSDERKRLLKRSGLEGSRGHGHLDKGCRSKVPFSVFDCCTHKMLPGLEWEKISVKYEGQNSITYSWLILMQPLGADHATVAHMKAMNVPFHLLYSSLFCCKGLHSDRLKCWC